MYEIAIRRRATKDLDNYSLRVGIYRVLYDIDDTLRKVTIYRIKHRRESYR